jgi:putative FmdB family regulatory protein
MPIYAYRCTSCGFEKDHLQKLSDPVLVTCPHCHEDAYEKQLTAAAGFQLKGSGWYATDFRGDKRNAPPKAETLPPACQCCPGAQACAGN